MWKTGVKGLVLEPSPDTQPGCLRLPEQLGETLPQHLQCLSSEPSFSTGQGSNQETAKAKALTLQTIIPAGLLSVLLGAFSLIILVNYVIKNNFPNSDVPVDR